MQPELIADYQCLTGEGPTWHEAEQRLYWTDIPTARMFRYDPATGQHEQFYAGDPDAGDVVGGYTIQADGALLLFMGRGAIKRWQNGKLTTLINEIPDEIDSRFNDVIADPAGRVFCGTMSTPERKGRLYRLDTDGTLTKIVDDVGTSNGMGFTLDRQQMYHTDTRAHEIYLYDYAQESGAISNRRVFLHVDNADADGRPDGMTVDAAGHVWSARWDGGVLVRHAPDGKEVARYEFPARKISSVTFGGPDYTDIYVTTAGGDKKATDGEGAGALFRLQVGIKGLPEFLSQVHL